MGVTKAVTVQLDPSEYDRLATEAKRLGVALDSLARDYLRAGLTGRGEAEVEKRRRAGMAALKGLAALRERLPEAEPVDVVQLIREGREGLERRTVA